MDRPKAPAFGFASSEAMIEAVVSSAFERKITTALDERLRSERIDFDSHIETTVEASLDQRLNGPTLEAQISAVVGFAVEKSLGLLALSLAFQIRKATDAAVQRRLGRMLNAQIFLDPPQQHSKDFQLNVLPEVKSDGVFQAQTTEKNVSDGDEEQQKADVRMFGIEPALAPNGGFSEGPVKVINGTQSEPLVGGEGPPKDDIIPTPLGSSGITHKIAFGIANHDLMDLDMPD
ncbi:hypothetical protein MMC21_000738 [Puttea exsequens]|nr:hypothetical protein [Puttea exsequens]